METIFLIVTLIIIIMALIVVKIYKNKCKCKKEQQTNNKRRFQVSHLINGIKIKGENIMLEVKDDQTPLTTASDVMGINREGQPRPLENLTFESSQPDLMAVTVNPDFPNRPILSFPGEVTELTAVELSGNADALPGEGEEPISGVIEIVSIRPSTATGFQPIGSWVAPG